MPWTINGTKYLADDITAIDDVTAGDDVIAGDDLVVGDDASVAGYTSFGAGTTSNSLGANGDVFIGGKLEVDGVVYSDTAIYCTPSGNYALRFQNSGSDFGGICVTNDDSIRFFLLGTDGKDNNNLLLCSSENRGESYGHNPASSNPTLILHSIRAAAESIQEYASLSQESDDFVMTAGHGGFLLKNAAQSARGTVTFTGLPTADDTITINATTITFKADGSGDVDHCTIGADAAGTVTNLVTTLGECSEAANLTAWDGAGDTVVIEWGTAGTAGNSIVFTESADNTTIDGSGTLGGTHAGVAASTLLTVPESGAISIAGDITMTGGGTITTSSNGDLILATDGTGVIKNTSDYFTDSVLSQDNNTFFGVGSTPSGLAHAAGTEGYRNTNLGNLAGSAITSGYQNACFGYQAGLGITTGYGNLCFGALNGGSIAGGAFNIVMGVNSGTQISSTDYSVFIGVLSGRYINGNTNVGIGYSALEGATGTSTGAFNTAIGGFAGEAITTGGSNVIVGYGSGQLLTEGNQNVILGYDAGDNITTGSSNVVIGPGVDPASATNDYQLNICNVIKCSNWNSNGDLVLLPNGTGITQIGDAGSTSHALAANDDLFVSGKLEVDGIFYADSSFYVSGATFTGTTLNFGTIADRSSFYYNSTGNYLNLGLGSALGRQLNICEFGNYTDDYGHAAAADPVLYIHSATAASSATDQWISLTHDQTNGVIQTGKGNLTIGSGSTSHSLTTPNDLFVSGKLEVDGSAYFDGGLLTPYFYLSDISYGGMKRTADDGLYILVGSGDGQANHHVIITSSDNSNKNHGLSTLSTNPEVYIFSADDPSATGGDKWMSLSHNQTNPVIACGTGELVVPTYTSHKSILANAAVLGPNAPTATTIGTARGLGFDADNESAHIEYEVPDSWDGASDLTLKVYWSGTSGDAIADTEQVKWDCTYRSLVAGEAIDNGTATTATATYTQSGAGTDKEFIETAITIDYDDANQPLAAGDLIVVQFDRDITGEAGNSYSGAAIVYRWEINCNVNKLGD